MNNAIIAILFQLRSRLLGTPFIEYLLPVEGFRLCRMHLNRCAGHQLRSRCRTGDEQNTAGVWFFRTCARHRSSSHRNACKNTAVKLPVSHLQSALCGGFKSDVLENCKPAITGRGYSSIEELRRHHIMACTAPLPGKLKFDGSQTQHGKNKQYCGHLRLPISIWSIFVPS